MKALILAAGFGSRLMPLTEDKPKCMVEYKGKKLIDYELNALKEAEIYDIAVVGGYKFDVLKQYLSKNYPLIRLYENKNYATTNMVQTFFCAREFLQNCIDEKKDLIISYADIIYSSKIVSRLKQTKNELDIVVDKAWLELWKRRFEDVLADAESLILQNGKIKELGKKPKSLNEIEGQYLGLFKVSYKFLEKIIQSYEGLDREAVYDGKDFDNMYMTSFLQILIDKFDNAFALEIEGGWCEFDFKKDLELDIKGLDVR